MAVGGRAAFVEAVAAGAPHDDLTDREAALLAYAAKLTVSPASVVAADIEALRTVGLEDLAVHDACAIIAYFAFVNRIADGLGVELETRR